MIDWRATSVTKGKEKNIKRLHQQQGFYRCVHLMHMGRVIGLIKFNRNVYGNR